MGIFISNMGSETSQQIDRECYQIYDKIQLRFQHVYQCDKKDILEFRLQFTGPMNKLFGKLHNNNSCKNILILIKFREISLVKILINSLSLQDAQISKQFKKIGRSNQLIFHKKRTTRNKKLNQLINCQQYDLFKVEF
ncbi:hypothetical protein pb186bvf_017845 [Paramecium bursaria]